MSIQGGLAIGVVRGGIDWSEFGGGGVPAVLLALRALAAASVGGSPDDAPALLATQLWQEDFGFLPGERVTNDSGKRYLCTANATVTDRTLTAGASGTSATMTANWSGASGDYYGVFSDGQSRVITLTNGAASVSWSGTLTGTLGTRLEILGKSASSGGPTGVGTGVSGGGPITDGALTWYYVDDNPTLSDDADAPTIEYRTTAPSGYTTRKNPVDHADLFIFGGGQPYEFGTTVSLPSSTQYPALGNATSNSGGSPEDYRSANSPLVEFWTTEQTVVINGSTPHYANTQLRIAVGDRFLTDGGMFARRLFNPGFVVLNFPTPGVRRIRMWMAGNGRFQGVWLASGSISPNPSRSLRMTATGTSMTQGANGLPFTVGEDWPSLTARRLGIDQVTNAAVGGAGFISDNGGLKTNMRSAARIADIVNSAPDVLLIENHNDDSFTSEERQAAYVEWLTDVRAALPDCLIIMFGQDNERQELKASFLAVEADLLAVVTALGGSVPGNPRPGALLHYKPIMNDPDGVWHTGTGRVTAQTGVGNSDLYISSDGLHPSAAGIEYRAQKYYTGVLQVVGLA